jgi:deoxyribodipyrimidine photo-lyase
VIDNSGTVGCLYIKEIALHSVPQLRIQKTNDAPVNPEGDFVLYWMIAFRRVHWNYSLQRAVDWAKELKKPLIVLEALRCGYQWASDRLHRFILDGMADNARSLKKYNVLYYPFVEEVKGKGQGLIEALAEKSCVVITDDFPAFFLPRMVAAVSQRLPVILEKVDSNGLLPMRAADKVFTTAFAFRRFLQKSLPGYLTERPEANPLHRVKLPALGKLPKGIEKRWPLASSHFFEEDPEVLAKLPIDHDVNVVEARGGSKRAEVVLESFLQNRLSLYPEDRNHPDQEGTSKLSPYLHFGHISVHQVFDRVMKKEEWSTKMISNKTTGSRSGWWGMSEAAEAFLDELVTWRELGFNMCWQREDYDQMESLPEWAVKTLKRHAKDKRPYLYTLEEFEKAKTHDPLWNAAQIQLIQAGRIHNYLRMLWGKKILHWSKTPREALKVMIELNNKYALDGRDPNSYSGIFWVLGRYDRAWGPERDVFGKVRYMSSKNTARKVRLKAYLNRYAPN